MAKKPPENRLQQSSEVTPYVCLQISCDDALYAFRLAQSKNVNNSADWSKTKFLLVFTMLNS
jgi:hypothetical protein